MVRYLGNFIYSGHKFIETHDANNNQRQAIVFLLQPVDDVTEENFFGDPTDVQMGCWALQSRSLSELRALTGTHAKLGESITTKLQEYIARSAVVKEYALRRAQGVCECCLQKAPFNKANGAPFLEVHHIHKLSDGGPDAPGGVAGICPNCHREAHYGENHETIKQMLIREIARKEHAIAALERTEIGQEHTHSLALDEKQERPQ